MDGRVFHLPSRSALVWGEHYFASHSILHQEPIAFIIRIFRGFAFRFRPFLQGVSRVGRE